MISNYTVTGMTCGHCVNHVTEEVSAIAGVDEVNVELDGGRMQVISNEPIALDQIRDAVAEAGDYTVEPTQ